MSKSQPLADPGFLKRERQIMGPNKLIGCQDEGRRFPFCSSSKSTTCKDHEPQVDTPQSTLNEQ